MEPTQFHGELVENYKDGSLFDANTTTNVFISGCRRNSRWRISSAGLLAVPSSRISCGSSASFEGYRQSIQNTVTGNVPPAYLRPGYNGNGDVDFGLVQTMDPGYLERRGKQADPYVLYGLTLYQPGDSTNPSNPNNAICSPIVFDRRSAEHVRQQHEPDSERFSVHRRNGQRQL